MMPGKLKWPRIPPGVRTRLRDWDERASVWFTPVVKWVTYTCLALFLLRVLIPSHLWVSLFATSFVGTIMHFRIWQVVTYAFVHDNHSIFHVLCNLIGLYFFGTRLEIAWGSARFLRLFLATAIG